MAEPPQKRATYQDVLDAPPDKVAQVIDGVLYLQPRPVFAHQTIAGGIGAELELPFRRGRGGPGGWLLVPEPEVHFGADVLVPDWAGWRRERLSAVSGSYVDIAPDWVCEILSPSTARIDRVRKLPVYAREGVKHAWLIDPRARTLEVFRLEGGRWLLLATHAEDELVRIEPFDAIEFNLATLWADMPPSEDDVR